MPAEERAGQKPGALPETPYGLTKVFIDYLPRRDSATLQQDLEKFFGCGKIITLLKKPGKTFGYAIFRKPNSVRLALRKDGCEFEGRRLRVEVPRGIAAGEAAPAPAPAETPQQRERYRDRVRRLQSVQPERQVFLSGLATPVNDDILRDVIRRALGQAALSGIDNMKFLPRKGACFITLKEGAEGSVAALVQALDGLPLLSNTVRASPAAAPGTLRQPRAAPGAAAAPEGGQSNAGSRKRRREDEPQSPPPPPRAGAAPRGPPAPAGCTQVLVGELPDEASAAELRGLLGRCGRVEDVRILRHRITGQPLGLAQVRFASGRSAREAVALSGAARLGRGPALQIEYDAAAAPAAASPAAAPARAPPAGAGGGAAAPPAAQAAPSQLRKKRRGSAAGAAPAAPAAAPAAPTPAAPGSAPRRKRKLRAKPQGQR
eukprot:TRINITY_DN3537_c0_g1_i1.p2 TRINITY_DN3537_c0_g1~~TRINITY_DN3537_c0_g1_i1.p2  ORF type:complete len:456 (+),score=149.39 TRINITY_DN3537_c0_g1_i1:75-1370(+)